MKRTIVKFGVAVCMMGMFALMPACKEKPVEEAEDTTEVVVDDATVTVEADAVVDTSGKDIKTGDDPSKKAE